jgi:hypothetical protein
MFSVEILPLQTLLGIAIRATRVHTQTIRFET